MRILLGTIAVVGSGLLSWSLSASVGRPLQINAQTLNHVAWFGVRSSVGEVMPTQSTVQTVAAPAWMVYGTSLFQSSRWALLGGITEIPVETLSAQMSLASRWVQEGQVIGAFKIKAIHSDEVIVTQGSNEWTLKLVGVPSVGGSSQGDKVSCEGGVIKVPKLAIDVLDKQQALLLGGVTVLPNSGGVSVRPELAALLGGLGFLAGDVLVRSGSQVITQPSDILSYVVAPLMRGQLVRMSGKRAGADKEWQVVSESACR